MCLIQKVKLSWMTRWKLQKTKTMLKVHGKTWVVQIGILGSTTFGVSDLVVFPCQDFIEMLAICKKIGKPRSHWISVYLQAVTETSHDLYMCYREWLKTKIFYLWSFGHWAWGANEACVHLVSRSPTQRLFCVTLLSGLKYILVPHYQSESGYLGLPVGNRLSVLLYVIFYSTVGYSPNSPKTLHLRAINTGKIFHPSYRNIFKLCSQRAEKSVK